MNLLSRLFGGAGTSPANDARWIVLDVETTGLDIHHDHLLAIAAIALRVDGDAMPRVELADSFEAVLQHHSASTDKENILLHGIGVGAQRAGAPAAEVLAAFERWSAGAPRVGYHVAFDRAMIERATKAALGRVQPHRWLDLAPIASALHPDIKGQALDDWLHHFGIACTPRHQAAADTLATAELLQRLWPALRRQGRTGFAALSALERDQRWLSR